MTASISTQGLDALGVFFLDTRSVLAARLLASKHLTAQCRALGRVVVQIARDAGLDVSKLPRAAGPYEEQELLTIGLWATESPENYRWFTNYTREVFWLYRRQFGQKRFDAGKRESPDHASQEYCEWCWEKMQEQGLSPAWRSRGFSAPPVPGVDDALTVNAVQNRQTWNRAAEMSLRVYRESPVVKVDPLQQALLKVSAVIAAHPRAVEWAIDLIERPNLLQSFQPNHPVVRVIRDALGAGASSDAIRDRVSPSADDHHAHCRQRAA